MISALLSNALAACSGDPPATTIHITSGIAPALVAFRDGIDAAWQPATMETATSFEAVVHGPYVVTVVCAGIPQEGGFSETSTSQSARTPDDPHDLSFCDASPTEHRVTGHMVQAGFVQLGGSRDQSRTTADWDFQVAVPDGTYDLIATTTDGIAVRRGIAVTGDLTVTPPIDVANEGTTLVDVAFTAPNAAPDEALAVSVGLLNPTTPDIPANIYLGPLATAKAAPDSALLSTDVQSASVRATKDTATRALRRPFRVGDDTAYMLPPPLGGVQWAIDGGELSVSWTALPDLDFLSAFVGGNVAGSPDPVNYDVDLSSAFVTMTGITQFAIDTDITGHKAEWKIDFAAGYNRGLTAQKGTETGVLTTSSVTESVNQEQVGDGSAPRAAYPDRGGARP